MNIKSRYDSSDFLVFMRLSRNQKKFKKFLKKSIQKTQSVL